MKMNKRKKNLQVKSTEGPSKKKKKVKKQKKDIKTKKK